MGEFTAVTQLMMIIPILILIFIIVFVIRIIRRMEHRSEERLKLDKENTSFQQKQTEEMNALNKRLTKIENMLRDVE